MFSGLSVFFLIFLCVNRYINYERKDFSYQIIGAASELHKDVGPGLFESNYENTLA